MHSAVSENRHKNSIQYNPKVTQISKAEDYPRFEYLPEQDQEKISKAVAKRLRRAEKAKNADPHGRVSVVSA